MGSNNVRIKPTINRKIASPALNTLQRAKIMSAMKWPMKLKKIEATISTISPNKDHKQPPRSSFFSGWTLIMVSLCVDSVGHIGCPHLRHAGA